MSEENPLVSVIVPTYKRESYLKLTIESVLAQTYSNLELLVISDGEDSLTRATVEQFSDPRLKYVEIAHAGLPAVPRNHGLEMAKGLYIAFCDDDDLWLPNKLQRQVSTALDGAWGLVASDYRYIDENGSVLPHRNYYAQYYGAIDHGTLYRSMGFICNASVIIRRDVIESVGGLNVDSRFRAFEDYEYMLRVLSQYSGFLMPDVLVSYRLHPKSISKGTSPLSTFRSRLQVHELLRQRVDIPLEWHLFKLFKLSIHFLMDSFPILRVVIRKLQGHTELPER